tara:strand:- start:765 stop:1040 length:276 start_codon:yes stop_codon:yes gene_type:complete
MYYFDEFKSTYVIAEIIVSHNNDIDIEKKLIQEDVNCFADAVKFQSYKSSKLALKNSPEVENQPLKSEYKNESYRVILSKYKLSEEDHYFL